jgi:hypothetical protein
MLSVYTRHIMTSTYQRSARDADCGCAALSAGGGDAMLVGSLIGTRSA